MFDPSHVAKVDYSVTNNVIVCAAPSSTSKYEGMYYGRNPVSKHQIQLSMEMTRLTRDGTAEPVSRDPILRYARGQRNIHFSCSADHEQDWLPYPVDPYSVLYVMTISHYCCCLLFLTFSVLVANPENYFTRWPIPLVIC